MVLLMSLLFEWASGDAIYLYVQVACSWSQSGALSHHYANTLRIAADYIGFVYCSMLLQWYCRITLILPGPLMITAMRHLVLTPY